MSKLLLATRNPAKAHEYTLLLAGIPFEIVTLDEQGIETQVSETGQTLEENATLKAVAHASLTNLLALADDSGLEVDALGGEPGVLSARYAGAHASDDEMIEHLLTKLKGVPWERRSARFRCVIVIASPGGWVELCHGQCKGVIALSPKGENGFGYDPVFYLSERGKTMAELSLEDKNQISHRGLAAKQARQTLLRL
ncbi:XTP/dITP diphosphatase [Chloroflexota bacterium]